VTLEQYLMSFAQVDPTLIEQKDEYRLGRHFTELLDRDPLEPDETALVGLADRYAAFGGGSDPKESSPQLTVLVAQLRVLLGDAGAVLLPGFLRLLERLATSPGGFYWNYNMFRWAARKSEWDPRLSVAHVKVLDQITHSALLWAAGQDAVRHLFASVMEGLRRLAERFPAETFRPRIDFIERSLAHGDPSDHQRHYLYSFRTDGEIASLRALIEDRPLDDPLAVRIEGILIGAFEDTLWA